MRLGVGVVWTTGGPGLYLDLLRRLDGRLELLLEDAEEGEEGVGELPGLCKGSKSTLTLAGADAADGRLVALTWSD